MHGMDTETFPDIMSYRRARYLPLRQGTIVGAYESWYDVELDDSVEVVTVHSSSIGGVCDRVSDKAWEAHQADLAALSSHLRRPDDPAPAPREPAHVETFEDRFRWVLDGIVTAIEQGRVVGFDVSYSALDDVSTVTLKIRDSLSCVTSTP